MAVLVSALARPAEGTLECETVYQIELLPHHDASSGFSCFLYYEVAVGKLEVLRILGEQQREDALFKPICLLISTAVHE